jgi:hypothetical protein
MWERKTFAIVSKIAISLNFHFSSCKTFILFYSIIGVVQMVNKQEGVFTSADEESFETFAIYCGLALHHAKVKS